MGNESDLQRPSTASITSNEADITADARVVQERDGFCSAGWLKLVAPAKVNLFLGIGARRDDGYHEVTTVLHALSLHDTIYMRRKPPSAEDAGSGEPLVRFVSCGDVPVPDLASGDDLSARAIRLFAEALGLPEEERDLELRIEKSIPFQAGLGGASSDGAAALLGAAALWGIDSDHPALEESAMELGADVAFFLRGSCGLYGGLGERFIRGLEASSQALALVKPSQGVPTSEAYGLFDEAPVPIPSDLLAQVDNASRAEEVPLFNNLAPAAQSIVGELSLIHQWMLDQPGVEGVILSGSGAATFGLCQDFPSACSVVGEARKQGLWARTTTLSSLRATLVSDGRMG